ncbi:UDP-N-acetylmuramate--L-alanine ligase [Aquimarina muelleri]|uniref:UDP-N-acetylmuramate--L-alanine ligase n=1 Tax=Aquimarina muelleri TaxID=279356 RepID=A0A918JS86_9FLAO|nr:UDP-N-acetylmuramate--L-alanine ligase [Aquimarina muelleri]MCX2763129.1 UDP-N-acetylmuramate--L-alanine ligase [Aquimarina muelleri]GGX06428.1 UDP-N-acetylmuramate--L-alanine ligase [Aquimarina muelleri]
MNKSLENIQNIYFIGIGGIGMSSLARYFKSLDKNVAGYDKTPSKITSDLITLGIPIHFEDNIDYIPKEFLNIKDTLIVYTPAIPKEHTEFVYFQNNSFFIKKRAQVLGIITKGVYTLAVAGTHGKTTTTAILGHLLKESGVKVTAFLGGISENYNSNLILEGNEVIVVEADEFDRSFLQLYPDIVAITSMDADHLDIYEKANALEESFVEFSQRAKDHLLVRNGLSLSGITFGIEDDSDYCIKNIRIDNGVYVFDLKTPQEFIENLHLNLPGKHNLLNAITAFAIAMLYGTPTSSLVKALFSFKGVQRRFSYQIKKEEIVYIDDYAHHPTEINALHQAVREMHPNKKVLAIFQPHLYSRTRDFASDFAQSLSQFDQLLLLDIYPARELPIEGVNSDWLLNMVDMIDKKKIKKNKLITEIMNSDAQVILTIGAGDIGEEVGRIKEALLV